MHLLSVYASFLAHTMSRQRVNKQSVRERRHMLERFVYIRIPRFVVGEASIESGSRHRLLFMAAPDPLLAADNFFSLFF